MGLNGVTGRPVVLIQCENAFADRRRTLPLAAACRARGWDPLVVVGDRGAASPFLFDDIACICLDDLPRPEGAWQDVDLDIDDLCALEILEQELAGRSLSEQRWSVIRSYTTMIWRMLDDIAPKAIFVWDGHSGPLSNALRIYKSQRQLAGGFIGRAVAAGGLFVDRAGVNGRASTASDASEPPRVEPSRGAAPAARRIGPFDKVVFVPLQKQASPEVLLDSPRVTRMRDLALFGLKLCAHLGDDWRLIVQPHPGERDLAQLNLPVDARLTIGDPQELEHWLDRASACLTLNSETGLLAALRGMPTICLGDGVFCRRPFVVQGQECDLKAISGRLAALAEDEDAVALAAAGFIDELRRTSLFWSGQALQLAADKLSALGLERAEGRPADWSVRPSGGAPICYPGAAYREMRERLSNLQARTGPLHADFDFQSGDALFLHPYGRPDRISREGLTSALSDLFGPNVALSRLHRAVESSGRVLLAHSSRKVTEADGYEIVLDEFSLPHARTYSATGDPLREA